MTIYVHSILSDNEADMNYSIFNFVQLCINANAS